jgi:hypothetical protein
MTVPLAAAPPSAIPKSCSDEVFQAYLRLYAYAKAHLNAKVGDRQEWRLKTGIRIREEMGTILSAFRIQDRRRWDAPRRFIVF